MAAAAISAGRPHFSMYRWKACHICEFPAPDDSREFPARVSGKCVMSITDAHCPHYFVHNCNLFGCPDNCYGETGSRLISVTQPSLAEWFISTYTVFQKSDAKIQITITTVYLIRIKYPLSGFNYDLFDVNVANFNKIYRTVS